MKKAFIFGATVGFVANLIAMLAASVITGNAAIAFWIFIANEFAISAGIIAIFVRALYRKYLKEN